MFKFMNKMAECDRFNLFPTINNQVRGYFLNISKEITMQLYRERFFRKNFKLLEFIAKRNCGSEISEQRILLLNRVGMEDLN